MRCISPVIHLSSLRYYLYCETDSGGVRQQAATSHLAQDRLAATAISHNRGQRIYHGMLQDGRGRHRKAAAASAAAVRAAPAALGAAVSTWQLFGTHAQLHIHALSEANTHPQVCLQQLSTANRQQSITQLARMPIFIMLHKQQHTRLPRPWYAAAS
jgi:hypothetical protein